MFQQLPSRPFRTSWKRITVAALKWPWRFVIFVEAAHEVAKQSAKKQLYYLQSIDCYKTLTSRGLMLCHTLWFLEPRYSDDFKQEDIYQAMMAINEVDGMT